MGTPGPVLKKIVVDAKIPFLRGVLEPHAVVAYLEGSRITRADVADADALIVRTRTTCNAALLEGTRVRFIATATIGYDHIDTDYCLSRGIAWTNAEGCNSSSVQQYLGSALVHLSRSHRFPLAGKAIGIVGVGNVGGKVARLCGALGMRTLLNDPPRERREGSKDFVPLSAIAEQSDIVTFHVPLDLSGIDKTFHMADAGFLAGLRNRPFLINTSRGEVVETSALKAALNEKRLSGCVLDVWENEPDIDHDLLRKADLGTPHVAGYSADGKANGTAMSVQAVSRHFRLGLDGWSPPNVPLPPKTTMEIDATGLTTEDVLGQLIRNTYDIHADDRRLRESPHTFEQQRGEYPVRREFPAYTVRLRHANAELKSRTAELGFRLID